MTTPFHLFFSFSFLLLLHVAFGKDLIDQTCRKAAEGDPNVNFTFCTTTFEAVHISNKVNLSGLGVISMNLATYNASHTMSYIQKLSKSRTIRPYVKACLRDCFDLYSDSISSLNIAMDDIKVERYDEANVEISATMDTPVTCEEGFKERRGTKSPLTKRNNDLFQLSAIALSIINMLSQSRV